MDAERVREGQVEMAIPWDQACCVRRLRSPGRCAWGGGVCVCEQERRGFSELCLDATAWRVSA